MKTSSGHVLVLTAGLAFTGAGCVGFVVCAPATPADASSRTSVGSALRRVIISRCPQLTPRAVHAWVTAVSAGLPAPYRSRADWMVAVRAVWNVAFDGSICVNAR